MKRIAIVALLCAALSGCFTGNRVVDEAAGIAIGTWPWW